MKFSTSEETAIDVTDSLTVYPYNLAKRDYPMNGVVTELKGQFGPKRHKTIYELIIVLEGSLTISYDGKETVLGVLDQFMIEPGMIHQLNADYCKMLAVCSPQFFPEDIEFIDT